MSNPIQIPVITYEQLVAAVMNKIPDNRRGYEILKGLYPAFPDETLKAAAKEAAIRAEVPSHFE
jgi:hypothetical protein